MLREFQGCIPSIYAHLTQEYRWRMSKELDSPARKRQDVLQYSARPSLVVRNGSWPYNQDWTVPGMIPRQMRSQVLLLSFLALSLVAPAPVLAFTWQGDALIPQDPFLHNASISSSNSSDLNADGKQEHIQISGGQAAIISEGRRLWISPADWDVKRAQVSDLNRDGRSELALLIWRDFAPWPIDAYIPHPGRIEAFHNRRGRSCHLILIAWERDAFREVWAGSALVDPLLDFTAIDMDGDGEQELAALEGRYDALPNAAHAVTLWEWNGFGFTLLARSQAGMFFQTYAAHGQNGQNVLLVLGHQRRYEYE